MGNKNIKKDNAYYYRLAAKWGRLSRSCSVEKIGRYQQLAVKARDMIL